MQTKREKIINQIFFWRECKEYNLILWACPNFLFLVMGLFTVIAMLATYDLSQRFATEDVAALIVAFVAIIIFVPGSIIVKSFEKMANANRMKTEFVSIASHQLRSPSSAIKWSLNLLMAERLGKLTDKQKEYLVLVRENNERMIKIVNDLLNISRIEKKGLLLKQNELDAVEVIKKIMNSLNPFAKSKNIELKLEAPDNEKLKVYGDEVYFSIAIYNLVDNAVRYSGKEGKVKIKIYSLNNKNIRIEVQDKGVGIFKKEQPFVFQKFFRSQDLIRHQGEGTGLGLFIAKSIIEQMGGTIGFSSKEDRGTTFWLEVSTEEPKNRKVHI